MTIRNDLYIREENRGQLLGNGPVDIWMPRGLKCKPKVPGHRLTPSGFGIARARELAGGRVVCMGCQHGPCQVPEGIGHDRVLHVHKEAQVTLNKAMQAESVKLYRCHKLHATITLAHCKSLRGRKSCNFDGVSKPPQCNDCEDWMSWGDGETVEFKQPKEVTVPTKEKMRCAGCGEIKILQSKDLCHKCNLARIKAEKTENKKAQNTTPEGTVPTTKLNAETVRLDFDADMDLLEALSAQAHRNYRSISNEILAALRSATGVERPRKNAA